MTIYEYVARTRSDAVIDEAPYLHAAMRLGADIVRGLVQERQFAFVKLGPYTFNCDTHIRQLKTKSCYFR